ncbi:hypothetical protein H0A71_10715 [Alcaligenaceae bacterium]|nr:hypothetical protein [Alcaligenaceae bacterium]
MKTATLPSLGVDPQLRHDAEDALYDGETLSQLIEYSVRAQIELRKHQAEFLARGLASREKSHKSGRYVEPDTVLDQLRSSLQQAKEKRGV